MATSGTAQAPGREGDRRERWRRALPLALAFLLALIVLVIIGARTVRAIAEAHHRDQLRPGAATSVRPWMSLDYIAANYGVTPVDLLDALNLTDTPPHRRAPLEVIATREGRNLDADITTINALIGARGTPHTAPERPRLPFMPGGMRGTPGPPRTPGATP